MIDEQPTQQWLPFDFLTEQINAEDVPHYEEPRNDNEYLFECQYQYKVNGKQEALAQIYVRALLICAKMVNKETRRNKHIKYLSKEEKNIKAEDAVSYVISRLIKNKTWYIEKSFTAYLYRRVQHELYYRRKVDTIVDFVDLNAFYKEGDEDQWEESESS